MRKKFLRKDWHKKSRLGLRRKKKQVWRRQKGRHGKMREKRKGHAKAPSIGFAKKQKGMIKGMKPLMIYTLADLEKIKNDEIGIVASSIGKKKRVEIAKKALELNKKINFDAKAFLEKIEREKAEKEKIEKKKEEKEKPVEKPEEKKAEEKITAEEKKPEEKEKAEEERKEEEKEKIMMKEKAKAEHELIKPRKQVMKRVALKK